MLHIMIASNEAWIVPARESERRFVQFNVSDVHMQILEWFDPLFKQLEDGGLAAMLFDLLHHNLADWHPRNLPANTNLLEQQRLSLRPLDAWFVELLESGVLAGADPDQPHRARSGKWYKEIDSGDYTRTVLRNGLLDSPADSSRACAPPLATIKWANTFVAGAATTLGACYVNVDGHFRRWPNCARGG